jgi:hypothetical protein
MAAMQQIHIEVYFFGEEESILVQFDKLMSHSKMKNELDYKVFS